MPEKARRLFAAAPIALSLLLGVGSCETVQPRLGIPVPGPGEFPPGSYIVDNSPAWSPAGDSLYLKRFVPSTWGPPGIYVIGVSGAPARLVSPRNSAAWLHVSPDGRLLSEAFGYRLVLMDAVTGSIRSPLYSADGIESADWLDPNRVIVS